VPTKSVFVILAFWSLRQRRARQQPYAGYGEHLIVAAMIQRLTGLPVMESPNGMILMVGAWAATNEEAAASAARSQVVVQCLAMLINAVYADRSNSVKVLWSHGLMVGYGTGYDVYMSLHTHRCEVE
jgi:hypothetical protein